MMIRSYALDVARSKRSQRSSMEIHRNAQEARPSTARNAVCCQFFALDVTLCLNVEVVPLAPIIAATQLLDTTHTYRPTNTAHVTGSE
jgi:hypothetical protein